LLAICSAKADELIRKPAEDLSDRVMAMLHVVD
jgi:hypothetical protein